MNDVIAILSSYTYTCHWHKKEIDRMNKVDFVTVLADKLEVTKAQAGRSLTIVLEAMTEVFTSHEKLTLPGLGTIGVKKRAARTGRNPSTGKTIQIPEAMLPF